MKKCGLDKGQVAQIKYITNYICKTLKKNSSDQMKTPLNRPHIIFPGKKENKNYIKDV